MTAQELSQIHARFFNSPEAIDPLKDRDRFNKNLASRKPSTRPGVVIFNKGTFKGNIKRTFLSSKNN